MPVVIVKDNVQEVLDALSKAKARGLEAIGSAAESHAKEIITEKKAVDTGRLRASITHASDGANAYIGTNVEYAPYVEFGTSKMKARSYLRPAATGFTSEYKSLMEESLRNA